MRGHIHIRGIFSISRGPSNGHANPAPKEQGTRELGAKGLGLGNLLGGQSTERGAEEDNWRGLNPRAELTKRSWDWIVNANLPPIQMAKMIVLMADGDMATCEAKNSLKDYREAPTKVKKKLASVIVLDS